MFIGDITFMDKKDGIPLEYKTALLENKAGYTATPVACGWAGAVVEKFTRDRPNPDQPTDGQNVV